MIVNFLKTSSFLHFFTNSFLFLSFFCKSGKGNKITGWLKGLLIKTTITLKGENNHVIIEKGIKTQGLHVYVNGNNNKIIIGAGSVVDYSEMWIMGNNNSLKLGEQTALNNTEIGLSNEGSSVEAEKGVKLGGYLQLGTKRTRTESLGVFAFEGKKVFFGSFSAISDGVTIRTSDSHSIYDQNKIRINQAEDVIIGHNCWVCSGAFLLKGAKIGNGCIVGTRAVVTKDFSDKDNVIIVGAPAKIVSDNISWSFEI